MVLLRSIAEGEFTAGDPDEQHRYLQKLERAAGIVVKDMAFLPPSAGNLRSWLD
jgi:hypothetical protein